MCGTVLWFQNFHKISIVHEILTVSFFIHFQIEFSLPSSAAEFFGLSLSLPSWSIWPGIALPGVDGIGHSQECFS